MRVVSHFAVLFYVTLTMFLAGFLLVLASLAFPQFPFHFWEIQTFLQVIILDTKIRLITATTGAVMLFINYIFMKAISDDYQRERTIAFDNPAGRVSVSLSALEDLVRRVIGGEPEVKEARPYIRARKKAIDIAVRLILNADVNIPELTARLQDLVRRRVQDIIGVEETIVVRLHVAKISLSSKKPLKKIRDSEDVGENPESVVPFHGYRA